MPICIVERNFSGWFTRLSATCAALLPWRMSLFKLLFLAEIRAISYIAKTPFNKIKNMIIIMSIFPFVNTKQIYGILFYKEWDFFMNDYTICVKDVYKSFNVYLDKANTIKEKMLFFSRNSKEKREVLKGISLNIKQGEV